MAENDHVEEDVQIRMESQTFYTDAASYWKAIPATVDGVMGGFANLSSNDISGSKKFLLPFLETSGGTVKTDRALDCGAGIGRVSKRLLLPLFKEVDLEEQNPDFLTKAKLYLGAAGNRVGCYFPIGLQDFIPMAGRYDVIWCQWVLSHLRDVDFISFMMKCVDGLSENGLIVVKENIAQDENEFDEEDSSVTRTMDAFMDLFSQAKLTVVKQDYQPKWPTNMYGVAIFALRASSTSKS